MSRSPRDLLAEFAATKCTVQETSSRSHAPSKYSFLSIMAKPSASHSQKMADHPPEVSGPVGSVFQIAHTLAGSHHGHAVTLALAVRAEQVDPSEAHGARFAAPAGAGCSGRSVRVPGQLIQRQAGARAHHLQQRTRRGAVAVGDVSLGA